MTDALRSDRPPTSDLSDRDRDSRIEELLLAGLDHYFAGRHDLAINVWTRVLFLDRTHGKARAYIERARSALAERQREAEELLQTGADATHVSAETTWRLGALYVPTILALWMTMLAILALYSLTRSGHEENLRALEAAGK